MKRTPFDRYRDQLRALRDRIQQTAAGLEEQVRSPTGGEAGGGISNAPLHLADVGSEAYAQELSATLLENETYIRDEALAALERIDGGTYGRCERCGRDIVRERLEAIPYTRHCTPCAAHVQDGRAVNLNDGRPEGWLGGPAPAGAPHRAIGRDLGAAPDDVHAAGTPGGGTASGGLAGTNVGDGAPGAADLEAAAGSGRDDAPTDDDGEEQPEAVSGPSGGAVGGTPANKRARGGRAAPAAKAKGDTKAKKAAPKRTRK